jgi:hypothetical protein
MKIKAFDRVVLRQLREELNAALQGVAKKYGIKVDVANARFREQFCNFKLELAITNGKGAPASREAEDFKSYAALYGLKPSQLGKTIRYRGNSYTITGLATRSHLFPLLATRSDGAQFKLPVEAAGGNSRNSDFRERA